MDEPLEVTARLRLVALITPQNIATKRFGIKTFDKIGTLTLVAGIEFNRGPVHT